MKEQPVTDLVQRNFARSESSQDFLFETGPESAEDLAQALSALDEKNAGINFDPANLLWYDKTEPAVFSEKLFPYFRLTFCRRFKMSPREFRKN